MGDRFFGSSDQDKVWLSDLVDRKRSSIYGLGVTARDNRPEPELLTANFSFRRATLEDVEVRKNEGNSLELGHRRSHGTVGTSSSGKARLTRALAANNISKPLNVAIQSDDKTKKSKNVDDDKRENRNSNGNIAIASDDVSSTNWSKDGPEMLSAQYVKGLNQRLFLGGATNVNEHKRLVREIQLLKSQRMQQVRKDDHLISQQRQKIMRGKEDFQKKIAAAQQKGKRKGKAAAPPPISMPRLFHPEYTHRKTQVHVDEIALLVKGTKDVRKSSRLGQVISSNIKDMPAKLFRLGLADEKEGAAAELVLEIRDACELESKTSLLSKNVDMDREIQALIMANRRKEIVEGIIEKTRNEMERRKGVEGSYSRGDMKAVATSGPGTEENPDDVRNTLMLHSKLLQSHPLVTQAILLGGNIPSNLGGLGGRDFGREEKITTKVKKSTDSSKDSFELLQQEETKKGYCTVLGLLRAINIIETKCVQNRISKWCQQMAAEKVLERTRTKYQRTENQLVPLRGI